MLRSVVSAVVLVLLALACSGEESPPGSETAPRAAGPELRFGGKRQAIVDQAMASLANAPEEVQVAVLRTCDKWLHRDRECDAHEVRLDQLKCWLSDGSRVLESAQKRGVRQRATMRAAMRSQNVCMEARRWRLRSRDEDLGYF